MKPNVISTVKRTLALDNSNDTDRKFDISANVTVGKHGIEDISSGLAKDTDGNKAAFSSYNGTANMRVEFNGAPQRSAIVEAIDAFIADAEQYAAEF